MPGSRAARVRFLCAALLAALTLGGAALLTPPARANAAVTTVVHVDGGGPRR